MVPANVGAESTGTESAGPEHNVTGYTVTEHRNT